MARGGRGRGKPKGGRGTKGAPRGGGSRANTTSRAHNAQDVDDRHSYSLQEEARNTGSRSNLWSSETKLRQTKVNFISAGNMVGAQHPEDDEGEEGDQVGGFDEAAQDSPGPHRALAEMNIADGEPGVSDDAVCAPPAVTKHAPPSPSRQPGADQHASGHFVVDVVGSAAPVQTGLPPPTIRAHSPTPSDSSEEVILFTGRNRSGERANASKASTPGQTPIIRGSSPGIRKSDDPIFYPRPSREPPAPRPGKPHVNGKGHSSAERDGNAKPRDDALLADYIENLRENGELNDLIQNGAFASRDLGDLDNFEDMAVGRESHSPERRASPKRPPDSGWDSADLEDFDDLSTSDGVFEVIDRILSKRERSQGLQYLVVWEGHTVDDARWIPHSSLTMEGAEELIRVFEEGEKLLDQYSGWVNGPTDSAEDSESDDESEDVTDDEAEDLKDQEDLELRKIERMTDEKIARLLAKQEELGMGSDELMLFDDDDDGDDEDVLFEDEYRKRRAKHPRKAKESKRAKGELPSASLIADAYDEFDVMDWERPSLQGRRRGRKADLPFELSDSELEATLRSTWTRDRDNKRVKKQEREELRAAGLLGKRNKAKPDLRAKYKDGMDIEDIKDEIRDFLVSDRQSLPLPPMKKDDRRIVHEIANAFGLKSKSVGDNTSRFPTLYKTQRSGVYDEDSLGVIESRLNSRRFLPRMDRKAKGSAAAAGLRRRAGGRNTGNAAVSYRDGEVVGAAAPELGVENRGRAMLEKMGWSSGNALGALNNKGILQPVPHVVKVSKAGLG